MAAIFCPGHWPFELGSAGLGHGLAINSRLWPHSYLAAGWVLPRAVRVAGPCLSSSSPAPAHSQGSGLTRRKRGGKPNPQGLFKSVGHVSSVSLAKASHMIEPNVYEGFT